MKAQRVVTHRDQSEPATCKRLVETETRLLGIFGWFHEEVRCGMPLRMLVTKSPMPGYEELVITRCPWHVTSSDGVLL